MKKNILTKIIAAALSITTIASAVIVANAETNSGITYTGKALTPDIVLYDDDILLEKGTDYDLSYENNINVGTATIIVTFKGNYSGEKRMNFNIVAKALTQDDVVIEPIESQTYTGEPIEPKPTVKFGDVTLTENTDYELSYSDNTSAGTATVTVTFKGNYSGTATANFEITAKDLTNDDNLSTGTIPSHTYSGSPIEPKPEIKYGDKVLEENKDYTLSYENNTNAGTATVKIEFTGDYTGTTTVDFEITPFVITDDNVKISNVADQTYTGSAITPEVTVTIVR